MNWIQCLSNAIYYIEKHLTDEINLDEVSSQSYASSSHFQLIFHLVMSMTVGEYIRNRRLSLAAQDLLQPNSRIIDVAMRYQYDTQESFSKAFTRFHGVPPSKVQKEQIKLFYPLTINVTIGGGFDMSRKFIDDILLVDWNEIDGQKNEKPTSAEIYNRLVGWASKARGQNLGVFDAMSEWVLDDSQWSDEKLAENEQILIQGVFARFKEQNAKLRAYLKELEPSGVVNAAIFRALDRFDDELSGATHDERLRETVSKVFADFSVMRERGVREKIAGYSTGSMHKTDKGYINHLKDCDAAVQWTLFMPEVVKKHGHKINRESFEYIEIGKVRFIGLELAKNPDIHLSRPAESLPKLMPMLSEYGTEITALCHLEHHNGSEVNVDQCNMMGYFFKRDTPVPEGYSYYDVPTEHAAYAVYYSPNFDGNYFDAAYEFTRDQILGDNVHIPYPQAYWTAEVYTEDFFSGSGAHRFGYLFSVEL